MAKSLTKELLQAYMRIHHFGVIATASRDGMPEAALVDFAVTPDLEIIFETTTATRKFPNLKHNPRAEMVIGWDDNQTLQCRGEVDEPEGRDGERVRAAYLAAFAQKASHQGWPGNCYFRLRPTWFRFSDYNSPRQILELELPGTERTRKNPFRNAIDRLFSGRP